MMMTERKYPTRDSGPMYNFPMPTETLRAELAEVRTALADAEARAYAVTEELRKTKTELYDMKRERDKMRTERDKLLYDSPPQ
jgi:uncharacterized coiled-coil DUF342 family protein